MDLKVFAAVNGVLALLLAAFVIVLLTRGKDRIQIASVCLFLCVTNYAAVAWELWGHEGFEHDISVLVGAYAIALYVVVAFLAIELKRWAWQVAIGAFALHLASTVIVVPPALERGASGVLAVAAWACLGALGLWSCLHQSSRAIVGARTQSAA